MNKNNVLKAKVKETGKEIEVYKLKDGRYNIYLGDGISVSRIMGQDHMQVFEKDQLEFIKA